MQFDDRLATVLRTAASSEAGARTQFRQLLDLLGSMPAHVSSDTSLAAYERLADLCEILPPSVQSAILRAPGLRLRNRTLVAWLAQAEPQAAAAAMAMADLSESAWLYLIPRLPLRARGFLRHRRDLPYSARQVLERLGVKDLVLPEPLLEGVPATPAVSSPAVEPDEERPEAGARIGALVRRIEAFQRARRHGGSAPRLPLEGESAHDEDLARRPRAFDFATDVSGTITWADPAMAPLVVGLTLGPPHRGAVAALDPAAARAIVGRQPLRAAFAELVGPPYIAGHWRIDAAPAFSQVTGQFAGYEGRMRRPAPAIRREGQSDGSGDRMRQLLHELRTPVNAIQGFAELIQQQMFGSAPNEYRALAAAVAVDAARLMAGFDEIDRLARLETGALHLGEGECDLRQLVQQMLQRLEGVLRPRSARIELSSPGVAPLVPLEPDDAKLLCWRLLATLAGALAPGEIIDVAISSDRQAVSLEIDLPASLAANGDPFAATTPSQPRAVSAGMFGTGFTLRLARAEVEAAGGRLQADNDRLRLVLPALTRAQGDHTVEREGNGGAAA